MLTDGVCIVVAAVVIDLEFVVPVSYAGDVLADTVMDVGISLGVVVESLSGVLANATTDVVTGICVDLLDDINSNVLSDVMTTLDFATMAKRLEDSLLFR